MYSVSVDDAEDKLNELRLVISDGLTDAFKQHIEMSMQIDALAFETKSDDADSEDLNACVEKHASAAIDLIFSSSMDVTSKIVKLSYEEEKNLVACEASDEDCISGVIDNLDKEIEDIPATIQDGVSGDADEVNMHMEMLKDCGAQFKAKKV